MNTPSLVIASPIFTYGTVRDSTSPSHDSSAESVIHKVNPTPHNNPPNPVPNVPADTDSDPNFSYSYFLGSSDSSDDEYYKRIIRAKKNKGQGWAFIQIGRASCSAPT